MDFRQGTCTNCKNSFRVPATFTANKAKCPKCAGVVEIGPVQSASSAPKTDDAAAPKPVPAVVPPPKAAEAPAPAPKVASKPPEVQKPVTPKPSAPAASVKPAASAAKPTAALPKAAPVTTSKPSAPSVRSAANDAAAKVKSGAATKSKKAASADEDDDSSEKRPRHAPHKKSMAPALLGILGFLALGGVAYWFFAVKQPETNRAEAAAAKAASDKKAQELADKAAADKAAMDAQAAKQAPQATNDSAAAGSAAGATAGQDKPVESAAAKEATKKPADDGNVTDTIDIKALPQVGKWSQSSDEQWAELQANAATFMDLDAGAKANRAGKKLEEAGRAAFPAILNQFRELNLYTEDGYRRGDLLQKTLERICKGRNFGWQYGTEVKHVVYNKKAIQNWFTTWEKVGEDDAQWAGLTKQSKPADAEAGDGAKKGELDDF